MGMSHSTYMAFKDQISYECYIGMGGLNNKCLSVRRNINGLYKDSQQVYYTYHYNPYYQ